MHRIW